MANLYDVSLPISERMIVYPGKPVPSISRYASMPGGKVNESVLTLGSHTGTHVNSKMHIRNDAVGADALPLDSFYGKCNVFDLAHVKREIRRKDLEPYAIGRRTIILLKTRNSQRGYREFRGDYVHMKLDAAMYLVDLGVRTLGFDYLSVKKLGGDDQVHDVLISNMTLFEGLDLRGVSEGEYIFLGLPLRIDCDGAPARVILVED